MIATRILTPDDAAAYMEQRRQSLVENPMAFGASPEDDRAQPLEAVQVMLSQAPDSILIGAFDDGLIGSIGMYRETRRKWAHKVHVWGVYVSPESRGRGVGRALMQAVIDHARSLAGVDQVHLSVTDAAAAARKLYERMGFEFWGTVPDSIRDGDESADEHHYVLLLDR